jgi:hypothetical protein
MVPRTGDLPVAGQHRPKPPPRKIPPHRCPGLSARLRQNTSGPLRDTGAGGSRDYVRADKVATAYPVMGLVNPRKLAASCHQACALEADGHVLCWYHREGDTGPPKATAFHRIASLDNATDISVAGNSPCAVTRGGGVLCWGDPLVWRNWIGKPGELYERLAAVPERTRLIPKQVPGLHGITAIAGSERSMCAVSRRGLVYCWGVSLAERWPLTGGVDDMPMESHPRLIGGVKNAVEISVSGGLACARTRSGAVLCWGFQGVLLHRDGTPLGAFVYPPVRVPGISNSVSISERCALLADGKAICWSGV